MPTRHAVRRCGQAGREPAGDAGGDGIAHRAVPGRSTRPGRIAAGREAADRARRRSPPPSPARSRHASRRSRQPARSRAAKARKVAEEMQHVREAMRRDGVALVRGARWLEHVAEGRQAPHRTRRRRETARTALAATRLRQRELLHHRGLPGQRGAAALPRHARVALGTEAARHAADRFRRAISRRHHRHHAHVGAGRDHARAAPRRHAGAEGRDRAVAREVSRAARRANNWMRWRARRSGPTASITATAPDTASATA